jgi:hypothetical protein
MHKYIKFDKIAKKSRHPQEKVTYIYIYIYRRWKRDELEYKNKNKIQ